MGWRRKSVRLFQEPSVRRPPTDSVAASQSRSAQMFPSFSVSRFQRSIVRCLADNLALKCRQETANQRPDVFSLVPKIQTKEINDRQCSTHQRNVCQPISKQVCNDVNEPRQVCNDVPNEVCDNIPASVTKYVDDEQCSNVGSRKCSPATRLECTDVVEQVPRQTYETECKTEYTQECSQPRSGYGN